MVKMSSQMECEENGDEKSMDSLVRNVVIYILSQDEMSQPIKRADIVKNAFPASSKKYKVVMEHTKQYMKHALGLLLIDLDGTDKLYITTSKFQKPLQKNLLTKNPESQHRRTLLLIILSYIFMESNTVSDVKLWRMLSKMDLIRDTLTNYVHPIYGNVRKLCTTDFVRQMYLKMEKVPQSDPPESIFSWGPRAIVEFDKLEVLKFVCKMQSDADPQKFTQQWSQIQKEQHPDMQEAGPSQQAGEKGDDVVQSSQNIIKKKRRLK